MIFTSSKGEELLKVVTVAPEEANFTLSTNLIPNS